MNLFKIPLGDEQEGDKGDNQFTEWERVLDLLGRIRHDLNALPNIPIPGHRFGRTKFKDTYAIAKEISDYLNETT